MGTNYYLHENVCESCGRSDEPLHIGKSSAGWVFTLRIYPDKGINSLEDWLPRLLKGSRIEAVSGGHFEVTLKELLNRIVCRDANSSRHPRDLDYTPGRGTWDVTEREFS